MRQLAALALLGMLFLSGCVQESPPQSCASVPQEKFANCVYTAAVLEQNPLYCYSLPDLEKRATCMKHATDPAMRKVLQKAEPAEREAIFAVPAANETPAPAPQQPADNPAALARACDSFSGQEKDTCLKSAAVDSLFITVCDYVADPSTKVSCIAEVARRTKDLDSCKTLAEEESRNLCRLYAMGEESKS